MNRAIFRPLVRPIPMATVLAILSSFAVLSFGCGGGGSQAPPEEPTARALELRNLGLAQLENEDPAAAEETYRQLIAEVPDDPLPHANLAIATLRQQKTDDALAAIEKSLELAPGRGDLLALKGDVLQWSGNAEEALVAYRAAAENHPQDPEILYALYRQASTLAETAQTQADLDLATQHLAELRPENVVVLLAQGRRAVAAGDRAAATAAFLRIKELLWQAPEVAERAMAIVLEALEGNDLEAAQTPTQRLENVLKVTPMYRESLRELMTGIQGIPVARFDNEPPVTSFGTSSSVSFKAKTLDPTPTTTRGLVTGDFDGDARPDIARLTHPTDGPAALEIRLSTLAEPSSEARSIAAPEGLVGLLPTDLNNDGSLDLLGYGPGSLIYWKGDGTGNLTEATADLGLTGEASAAIALDYDIEGDLDLVLAGATLDLLRNSLEGPLARVGAKVFPQGLSLEDPRDLVASDLDRDGDQDLLIAHGGGLTWLDNLRQGQLQDRTEAGGLLGAAPASALISVDLDNDGLPEIVTAGQGVTIYRNLGGSFQKEVVATGDFRALVALDADNDGRMDLAVAGQSGGLVLHQQADAPGSFLEVELEGAQGTTALAAADLEGNGTVDLLGGGPGGLTHFSNLTHGAGDGAPGGHWLSVRLRGIDEGNSKNNILGLGATLEVFAGGAYQFREVTSDVTHFGLGQLAKAPLLRVVWTNGVPQNRIQVDGNQQVVETQVLKGSCPFLYVWNGEEMAFVTDLLWGAPLGMPVAPGVWASADPQELVRVDDAQPKDGHYDLRITEELWEAAFFDHVKLWVVDHPEEVEVASSLKILLGETIEDQVLASRDLRPVAGAWDAIGRQVAKLVATRDEVYVGGYEKSPYQGIAQRPWAFVFDLGEAPASSVRLHLDGWIFPPDASLNLAAAQRNDLSWGPPRLEAETSKGWEVLMPVMPFPAGKTKTMVIDTPPLPKGSQRLRIVTTQWLHWDRVAWTLKPADDEAKVVAKLSPTRAELRDRGYSAMVRQAPNAPHSYDYSTVSQQSPWLPLPGAYTRFGDVRELLATPDDRSVILAAGDEIALEFDASTLEAPKAGWTRTVFLESHGWDKDADRNTYETYQVEPLPFRAMSGYPYGEGESFPDTPDMRTYREEWLTRIVAP